MTSFLALMLWPFFTQNVYADYTIYPVPQYISVGATQVKLTRSVNVIAESGIDSYTIERLREVLTGENGITFSLAKKPKTGVSNVWLGIHGSKGKTDRQAIKKALPDRVFSTPGKYDRHVLSVRDNGKGLADIYIVGEHTNAVFYALATLEQMLEQANNSADGLRMPTAFVQDFADMQYRGIVEGYYGYPYSIDVKKDLIHFFKRFKMNTYLYGAKSDPYHSGYWRDQYPESITPLQQKNGWMSQQMISDLARLSLETKVNFIWAIHPNSGRAVDFHTAQSTKLAVSDVMAKFEKMYSLGVRQFAVFLDDAGWDFDDVGNYRDFLNNLQASLEEKYNHNYTNPSDTVLPIHYVPHIYAINFANDQQLQIYFDAISQTKHNIVVYTTGSGVWSTLRNADFEKMQQLMRRPVALWWNYPCNDNKDGRIYTADMFTNLHEMQLQTPDNEMPNSLGIVSNPMQQGVVAKISLFGIADYAWNNRAFNSVSNWEAAFPAVIGPQYASLYKTLAPYLRHDDPESLGHIIERYKYGMDDDCPESTELRTTLETIRQSAETMLALVPDSPSTRLLVEDLRPWLLKLSRMAETAQELMQLASLKDSDTKVTLRAKTRQAIFDMNNAIEYKVDALEGMGEVPPSELHPVEPSYKYLMPFIQWLDTLTAKSN